MTELIPVTRPWLDEPLQEAILRDLKQILVEGRLLGGPFIKQLEATYSEMLGVTHAVGLNTCTTALQLALRHFGARDHDVLVTSASFVTDVGSILETGARPVLVEIEPESLGPDLDDLERKVSARTKGMIWVHLTGIVSPKHERIRRFAADHGLFLIEDAAHAHGASANGQVAGSFGDAACFSFYATKVVTSGTGGLLATNDDSLAEFARDMRDFGKSARSGDIERIGSDFHLDEIRACVAFHHTVALPRLLQRRREIAERYRARLRNQPHLRTIDPGPDNRPAYYQFPVFLDERFDRDRVIEVMRANYRIACKQIYRPTHMERPFRSLGDGSLSRTEALLGQSLCLPIHAGLTDDQVDRVTEALIGVLRAIV